MVNFWENAEGPKKINEISFLTITLSAVLISCFIRWDQIGPISFPIIKKHVELIFLLFGWCVAFLYLFRSRKSKTEVERFQIMHKLFVFLLGVWIIINIVLFFARRNLLDEVDFAQGIGNHRTVFFNVTLSFLPWLFALAGVKASVFEKTLNYVAAAVQIPYLLYCLSVKSWYKQFLGQNRVQIVYVGLVTLPVIIYTLCVGNFKKKNELVLASANIILCIIFSVVSASRLTFFLLFLEMAVITIAFRKMKKNIPELTIYFKCLNKIIAVSVAILICIIGFNIYNAKENIIRSLSVRSNFENSIIPKMDTDTEYETTEYLNKMFLAWNENVEDRKSGAITDCPPVMSDQVRNYWKELAIENIKKNPIIATGRVSYSYISPMGIEYIGSAHNVIIDWWSAFGLPGLAWLGVIGLFIFVMQFQCVSVNKGHRHMFINVSTIIAEAASFGYAMTQTAYLYPFTFMTLIMVASWCKSINRECRAD